MTWKQWNKSKDIQRKIVSNIKAATNSNSQSQYEVPEAIRLKILKLHKTNSINHIVFLLNYEWSTDIINRVLRNEIAALKEDLDALAASKDAVTLRRAAMARKHGWGENEDLEVFIDRRLTALREAPVPRSVMDNAKAHVTDSVCNCCPCWQEKEPHA